MRGTLLERARMAGAGGAHHDISSEPWVSNHTASRILHITHYAYPIVILLDFLVAFTIHSILTAADDTPTTAASTKTGPGGKPLPRNTRRSRKEALKKTEATDFGRSQKLTLNWLVIGLIVTFLANAVNSIAHALAKRPWWCGEAAVVSLTNFVNLNIDC